MPTIIETIRNFALEKSRPLKAGFCPNVGSTARFKLYVRVVDIAVFQFLVKINGVTFVTFNVSTTTMNELYHGSDNSVVIMATNDLIEFTCGTVTSGNMIQYAQISFEVN